MYNTRKTDLVLWHRASIKFPEIIGLDLVTLLTLYYFALVFPKILDTRV